MTEAMKVQIITPDETFYQGDATMIELTTTEGDIGIYKNHIPLTAVVAPGILKLHEENGIREASLISGFITILPEEVTILAEVAEWPDEIDYNRANEARIRAERRLSDHSAELDVTRAELALKRAMVRLSLTDKR